jgi:hypothetical protein
MTGCAFVCHCERSEAISPAADKSQPLIIEFGNKHEGRNPEIHRGDIIAAPFFLRTYIRLYSGVSCGLFGKYGDGEAKTEKICPFQKSSPWIHCFPAPVA